MYVVTGATGNTGSVVARHLLDQKKTVRVIGRSKDRLQPLVDLGAEAFVADLSDQAALTKAFSGAEGVYAMVPPSLTSQDFRGDQRRVAHAIAAGLEQAGANHAVVLSSVGADKEAGTGPVAGLHEFEEILNRIAGLNVVHLRAGYFMENTLGQAAAIHAMGKAAGPLRGNLKLPMIATKDIGSAAAELLVALDFKGKQTRELLGQRDLSMDEVTAIIGKTIEKPDLKYVQAPGEQMRPIFIQMGMSQNVASLILEMAEALNSEHMRALEERSAMNTTPTSFETFVKEDFVPVYRAQTKAA
ncbi:MAG TPA: NmrA family NAD(P)-binding protein [Candidatus Angelobacter sp.]|nr:NmrA family NAD(P)-binding protein [Candidatus Angelobacter sp.]